MSCEPRVVDHHRDRHVASFAPFALDAPVEPSRASRPAIEAGSPNSLIRKGLRQSDFPIGSEVVVDGYRARKGTSSAIGTSVKFADGRNFFLGAPADAPPSKP